MGGEEHRSDALYILYMKFLSKFGELSAKDRLRTPGSMMIKGIYIYILYIGEKLSQAGITNHKVTEPRQGDRQ